MAAAAVMATAPAIGAQAASALSPVVRDFVTVSEPVVVLTNATVIDGTGTPPRQNQSIVIRDGNIADVGAAASVATPAGARVVNVHGGTVIPGLIGMHDHLFYTAAGGREMELGFSAPRLYLASGVTTIARLVRQSPMRTSIPRWRWTRGGFQPAHRHYCPVHHRVSGRQWHGGSDHA